MNGQARKEFDNGWKGMPNGMKHPANTQERTVASSTVAPPSAPNTANVAVSETDHSKDPLIMACENEGIVTVGKTRKQLASELSWKPNKK